MWKILCDTRYVQLNANRCVCSMLKFQCFPGVVMCLHAQRVYSVKYSTRTKLMEKYKWNRLEEKPDPEVIATHVSVTAENDPQLPMLHQQPKV